MPDRNKREGSYGEIKSKVCRMTKCEGIVGKCGDFEVDSGPDR